ncbi:MAG: cobalamin B12-binding domain-containing protein [Candidatus Portnoybacteria bacterium]|nr:cobalamin B12-binding domain-containing protein [Candidatus Portnoybacteria bacterium]
MKILFINPPFTRFGGMEGQGGKTAPLNLAYLAAYIREYHKPTPEIKILDAEGLRLSMEEVKQHIKDFLPDLVGMTMPTPAYDCVKEISRGIKNISPKIKIVVGGPHPSAFPETLIAEIPEIDFSIRGEGEIPLLELIKALKENGNLDYIPSLSQKKDEKVFFNPERAFIKDLDSIPFPARDLLPNEIYYTSLPKKMGTTKGHLVNIFSSRGCLYNCTYCESYAIWERKVRLRSAQNVVAEIEECVKKYGASEIVFHDDIFPINRERAIEICRQMKEKKLDIHWACMTRVNFVWENVMIAMKEAGCRILNFGFESGSEVILKNINKGATTEQARAAMRICKKIGLRTMGNFMIGNLGETEGTIRETINFAKELNTDTIGVFVTIPYPGTKLYEQAKELGYLNEKTPWKDYASVAVSEPPMRLPNLSPERLRYWQSRALREFYFRPAYILKRLREIRSWQDIKNLFDGFILFLKITLRISK